MRIYADGSDTDNIEYHCGVQNEDKKWTMKSLYGSDLVEVWEPKEERISMKLDEAEPCIVEFEDKTYLVFRESMEKGSDYLFVECGIASTQLIGAYFNELYKKD